MVKRYRRKKTYKRKARKSKSSIGYNNASQGPIPDRYICRLTYSDLNNMSSNYTAPGYLQYRINSLFKPNFTYTGHQPFGYDQLSVLYNMYRVDGMKYQIWVTNQSITDHAEVVVNIRDTVTLFTNFNTLFESPNNRRFVIGPEVSKSSLYVKGYVSVAKASGDTSTRVKNDDIYSANVGASPTSTPMLTVYCINQNVGANISVNVRVCLTYYATFFGRKVIIGS